MDFDVIIIGAGPAGCLAARDLARSGINVCLFDADMAENLGKPVIVEVEKAIFRTTRIEMPVGDEAPYHGRCFRTFTEAGREAFCVNRPTAGVTLYLGKFSRKLLDEAVRAGAKFHGGFKAVAPVTSDGKVCGAIFSEGDRKQEVRAGLVIDASGFSAALTRKLDPEIGIEFRENPEDLVIAETRFHEIDRSKAERAIKNRLARDEEVWARFGFAGNYSTETAHLSLAHRRAFILIGFKAGHQGPPIGHFIDQYRERQGYFAGHLHGGSGMIRISHSLDRLVADGFMVIGEAANQVIPTNGSGVASAMYAGHLAAKTAAAAIKRGRPTTAALWPYARQYQKGRGGMLATFNVSRLTIDAMNPEQLTSMLVSGVAGPEDFYNSSIPKGISLSPRATLRRLMGLAKNRDLIAPVFRMAAASVKLQRHYSRYPERFNPKEFAQWKRITKSLFEPFIKTG